MFSHARTKTRTRATKLKTHYKECGNIQNAVSMILRIMTFYKEFLRTIKNK